MVKGGVCGEWGACMEKGGHAWQRGGVHGERGCAWYACPPHEIRPLNARAIRILLECILVVDSF